MGVILRTSGDASVLYTERANKHVDVCLSVAKYLTH